MPSHHQSSAAPWNDRLLLTLLVISVIGIILQITLGGVVRVTGSGDACPDWPTCFGRWVPPADIHAILEWSHRTAGSVVGLVIIAALARSLWRHRAFPALAYLVSTGLVLIAIVGGIGGSVVLSDLDPAIRTAHLGLAQFVLLAMLLALVLAGTPADAPSFDVMAAARARRAAILSAIAAIASLVALLSGAYAVWRGAGAVCPSWPLCGGAIIPQSELVWIHVAHRLLAGVGMILAFWAAHRAFRLPGASAFLRAASLGVPVIGVAQILIGAANPWTGFDEWARAMHLSLATLLWANAALVAVIIWLPVYRIERKAPVGGKRLAVE